MNNSRKINIDMARILACLAVVLLHTTARTIYLYETTDIVTFSIANLLNSATRWCVPVFIMLSGALLLSKPIEGVGDFFVKRVRVIVFPAIFWTAAYLWWRVRYYNESPSLLWIGKEIFNTTPYYHLYFLYLIFGLYVFTPAFAVIVAYLNPRVTIKLSIVAISFAALLVVSSGMTLNLVTHFLPYIGYFLLGGVLVKNPWRLCYVLPGFLISVLITALMTFVMLKAYGPMGKWGLYFYNYFSPTVVIMSICVFCLFIGIRWSLKWQPVASLLAPLTLGIYLLHPMVLEWIRWQWTAYFPVFLQPRFEIPLSFMLTSFVSTVLVFFLRKIPMGRWIT